MANLQFNGTNVSVSGQVNTGQVNTTTEQTMNRNEGNLLKIQDSDIIASSVSPSPAPTQGRDDDDRLKEAVIEKKEEEKVTDDEIGEVEVKLVAVNSDELTDMVMLAVDALEMEGNWKSIDWDFDPYLLNKHPKVRGNCLVVWAWYLIRSNYYHVTLNLSPHKMIHFLYQIQEAYQGNPYHNKLHATDVVHNMHWFMNHCHSVSGHLTDHDKLIGIISAAIHDVDHDGKSNDFHREARSRLALRCKGASIQENHHISYAFKLIASDPKYDWIRDLNDEMVIEQTRKYLMELILGTDMSIHKKHMEEIEALKSKLSDVAPGGTLEEKDKFQLLVVMLHAADISNPAKKRKLCVNWAFNVVDEFRNEGDEYLRVFGKKHKNKLTHRTWKLEKSQPGFINHYVFPYFKVLNDMMENEIEGILSNLSYNLYQWKQFKEDSVRKKRSYEMVKVEDIEDQEGEPDKKRMKIV